MASCQTRKLSSNCGNCCLDHRPQFRQMRLMRCNSKTKRISRNSAMEKAEANGSMKMRKVKRSALRNDAVDDLMVNPLRRHGTHCRRPICIARRWLGWAPLCFTSLLNRSHERRTGTFLDYTLQLVLLVDEEQSA